MLSRENRPKLVWSEQAIEAFDHIKSEIAECHTLYFVDDSLDIQLQTDASDYGVGSYFFQYTKDL